MDIIQKWMHQTPDAVASPFQQVVILWRFVYLFNLFILLKILHLGKTEQ